MDNNLDDTMNDIKVDKFEDEIRQSYLDLSDNMPLPPTNAFLRIMDNVDTYEKNQDELVKQSLFSRVFQFIRDTVQMPKLGWAMAGAQFAVIIFIIFSQPSSNINNFQTLSINNVPDNGMEINIVFKENALQSDIRALLNNSDAVIINGPNENGLYILKIKQSKDFSIRLKAIGDSKIVKFVSKRL